MNKYDQLPNESNKAYRIRLYKNKDLYGLTNQEIGELCNQAFGVQYDESAHRKKVHNYLQGYEDAKIECKLTEQNDLMEDIQEQLRELEREKVKLRDERRGYNKQNYIDGRIEENLDMIADTFSTIRNQNFSPVEPVEINSDNDLLICLSDLHIGQTFDSVFGQYNSDIATERLNNYLSEILLIQKRHNSENAYVVCLGDLISGAIHSTIQISNRENVIEQTKLAIQMIASFCYELTKHFKKVFFTGCAGNHSRLVESKDKAVHSERLDDLISWSVSQSLFLCGNFYYLDNQYDVGIARVDIRDKTYIAVHGDMDNFSKGGVSNLAMFLKFIPYGIVAGHKHYSAMSDESGVRMVQSGTLAGSGDDYCIEKRLGGQASQTVCVCTTRGIECMYPINL